MKYLITLILTVTLSLSTAGELMPLFDLQTQSGQLWPAIKAHFDSRDAQIVALTKGIQALKDAHAKGDPALVDAVIAEQEKSAAQKDLEQAEANLAKAMVDVEEKRAAIVKGTNAPTEVGRITPAKNIRKK